ncbi:TPA: GGDEF domain-containing protein [Vibrio cholerae]|uniref:GGDEF domain-containing protein n=1 Tax=Vibrio cholerae TaxID=666 RepID=UPI00155E6137|nr:GGDEF domain-containing protein [Vibrio cholerae]NOE11792.1 bacteriohemerythrin [Vibrio cholerae]NOF30002.1 bacteriohemerythrin [Vibrio cholerae]HDI3158895.1 bacteriohemerythrin [Vibrio cholerae]HDZ3717453.1 bacteriohemerythrin [Vibrio cholerae]
MQSFKWDQYFETGLGEVDEQHQSLVNLINRYSELLSENHVSLQEIRTALFELSRYAEYHFKEEEQLMREVGISALHLEEHIQVHRTFMSEVFSMQAFIHDVDDRSAVQLLEFLIHWLAYHILGIDQNMARQVIAIRSGMSAEEAYAKEEREKNAATEPLLNALNALFDQVSERNRELVKLNQSLEEKVIERTQQLYQVNRQLEALSMTDSLTGLPNRRKAMRQLVLHWNLAQDNQQPFVCVMIDIDGFKAVNDHHGHDVGDKVLTTIANMLRDHFRNDDLVCRLGGDEFLVICPETNTAGGVYIAEQVCRAIQQHVISIEDNLCWQGSVSMGVAEFDPKMKEHHELLRAADQAVYLAKNSGKNRVCAFHAPS